MKTTILFIAVLELFSCNRHTGQEVILQRQIDSLQIRLSTTYKPGFGEFMSSIQAHHAKLWFAGKARNWKLADFEIHEIMEAIDDIENYETERDESQEIGMIKPALERVNQAIEQKDPELFEANYRSLTNTCNECHRATNFEFNRVKIPEEQNFSNQDFSVPQ